MSKIDIRPVKTKLRNKYKDIRRGMDAELKAQKDRAIFNKIITLQRYKEAQTLLTFVSTAIEVDTKRLIEHALLAGKKVAVPYCVPDTPLMKFYFIDSLKDLSPGMFNILEPSPNPRREVMDFNNSVSIIPGLAFDYCGFRLGYGKGYYDRFLDKYRGYNIGICYHCCFINSLPKGRYDKPVDIIITEQCLKLCPKK